MMRIFLIAVLGISHAIGAEFMEFGDARFKTKKLDKSKWVMDVGLDYLQYETAMPAFKGEHTSIKDQTDYEIFGMHLGFGREFSLGDSLSTTLKLGGFYNKTIEDSTGKASEDVDIDLASERDDHMVYGGEVSLDLNYLIETKLINIQPFIGGAIGTGIAQFEKEYTFQGLSGASLDPENYDIRVDENFNFSKLSLGVNFISNTGFLSYLKLSRIDFVKTSRKTKGDVNGTKEDSSEDGLNETTTNLVASLGIGFLF